MRTVTHSNDTLAAHRVTRSKVISIAVAVLLAVILLAYSLRGVEWRQVARIAADADPSRLGLAAAIMTGTLFVRSLRWRILLNAEGTIGVQTTFWATAVGYFGNNFLPARGGELVRTFMISARSTLTMTYVLATAIGERIADAVVLVCISATVLLTLPLQAGWLAGAARSFAILAFVSALVIAVLPLLESRVMSVLGRAPIPKAVRPALMTTAQHGFRGLRAFHDLRRIVKFGALTALIWSMDAIATVIGGSALGFAIPLPVAFLLIAALGLGSALPSMPGYVGIYQFVAVTVLTPFGFSRAHAIAYILVAQALMYVVIGFWGALGLMHYRRSRRSTEARAGVAIQSESSGTKE